MNRWRFSGAKSRGAVSAQLAAGVFVLASCGSTSQEITSPTASKCGISLAASATSFSAQGGTGQVTVATARECRWTAASDAPWIVLASKEGQGQATIDFSVSKTDDPVSRTGSVRIADQQLKITQAAAACRYELSRTQATVPSSGAGGDVDVTASSPLCEWTARSEVDWIAIKIGASVKGNGRVTFEVARTSGPPRTGRIIVADQPVTVTQSDGCSYSVSPSQTSVAAAGGSGTIAVSTAAGCPWTSAASASWLSITSGTTGNGSGTVQFSSASNTGPSRSGRIIVADQSVTVTQSDGCVYAVSPSQASVPAAGGSGSVAVTTAAACSWTSTAGASWLSITAGANGSGAGTVQFSSASNSGPARSGSLTVAGRSVSITQASGCSYSISPTSASFPKGGGTSSVSVSASAGCPWSAASQADWLTLTSGANGIGAGAVQFSVAPSVYEARNGTISVAGQTFTASQERGCTVQLSATSASFGPEGGSGAFQVTTYCPWRTLVEGGATWVVLTRGDRGNGSGPVWFTVAPNDGPARSATLLVEDHDRFTIYQAGR